jgi:hypothetical protein
MTSTSNQRTNTSKLTGRVCRSAAVLGLAAIGSLSAAMVGSAASAPDAGASPLCPPLIPVCTVTPTRPPVADPGGGVLDPGTGTVDPTPPTTTPPTTPPSTTPPGNGGQTTNNPPKTNTGGNANQTPTNETPVPAAETTSVDATKSAAGDSQSDDGGSSLPYLAIVGGVAALGAAGTGLYLRYGRRA